MPNNFGNENDLRCSFCGKPQSQAKRLIAGNGVYICDTCVELCMNIIEDEDALQRGKVAAKRSGGEEEKVLPKPQEIKKIARRVCDRSGRRQDDACRGRLQPL